MGDWILTPANNGLTSGRLREGLAALDDEMKGGPKEQIASAIMELLGATDRPPQLDEEKAAARTLAIRNMAWDYPIDVVQNACRNWRRVPQYGRWWPTEQDLRAQCEPLVKSRRDLRERTAALLSALELEEDRAECLRQPSPFAGGKHQAFREQMRKRMPPKKFEAYFNSCQIKYSGDSLILVRSKGSEDRLHEWGGDLLEEMGITLRFNGEAFLNTPTEWDLEGYGAVTDEERAEMAANLRKLAAIIGAASISNARKSLKPKPPAPPADAPVPMET